MDSPRRNSSQPPNQSNGVVVSNGIENGLKNGYLQKMPIPSVMTSPAIIPYNNDRLTEEETTDYSSMSDLPKPPDGGWGWAVVFASFMIHVIADGVTYTLGVYAEDLKKEFGDGSTWSFIPSILVGVTLGSGPVASMLTNIYGCRVVTILGAICAAFGLAISAAAPNLIFLFLSIGIITGLGFGLIYLPAIVSVSMYFEKKRGAATGIAVCGSGIGTAVISPVTHYLIQNYGWKGGFLITGAICLLNILFGALFKPLPMSTAESCSTEETPNLPDLEENNEVVLKKASKNHSFCSDNGLPPEIRINGEPCNKTIGMQMGIANGKYSQVARLALSTPSLTIQPSLKSTEKYGSHSRIYDNNCHHVHHRNRHCSRRGSGVMLRKDILYAGSLFNIPEYKGPKRRSKKATNTFNRRSNPRRYSRHVISHIKSVENAERSRLTSETNETELNKDLEPLENLVLEENEEKCCKCIPMSSDASKGFHQMLDLGLFKDRIFILFVISNFLTSIGFNVPYVYTVDRAIEELEIESTNASFLLSIIGISNMLARIILGYISDRSWINRLYLYNISLAICGISLALSNFCPNYQSQAVYCAVFGITSGAYVGLTSVVLVDLLGLDKLTNAFGLLLLFQGIASVIGPPFIGWLRDIFGDFQLGFYFAGAMIFISGVMLFVLPKLQREREQDEENPCEDDDDDRFPEIAEEEGYDSDDHQMTMEAKEANA